LDVDYCVNLKGSSHFFLHNKVTELYVQVVGENVNNLFLPSSTPRSLFASIVRRNLPKIIKIYADNELNQPKKKPSSMFESEYSSTDNSKIVGDSKLDNNLSVQSPHDYNYTVIKDEKLNNKLKNKLCCFCDVGFKRFKF
jgi:hypothetical protein